MANHIPFLVTAGIILAVATMFFPIENIAALKMRIVRGSIFGIEGFLTFFVVHVKFPLLGWRSTTIPLFILLTIICIIIMFNDLSKALTDLFCGTTQLIILSKVKFGRSTILRELGTEYSIQGYRPDGKKIKIRVTEKTFDKLRSYGDGRADDRLRVEVYPKTNIFISIH